MELLFQVLLQFGDSRKVVEITEQSKDEVISKVKRLFDINTSNELLLQEYEDEWQEWVDVEDVHRIKDKATRRYQNFLVLLSCSVVSVDIFLLNWMLHFEVAVSCLFTL